MAALINTGVSRTAIEDKLKKFDNIITVSKTGHGDFVCSDVAYTSDDQCIQAALDYLAGIGGGELVITDGTYNCVNQLSYNASNIVFRGQGNKTIFNFTSFPASPLSFIWSAGAITTTNSALSANADKNTLTITVANGALFTPRDWIRIRSNAVFTTSTINTWVQTVGEIQQIESIDGNIITLKERLLGEYKTTDAATVDLVTMLENITFKDFKIVGAASVDHIGIQIRHAHNVIIDNITCDDVYERAIFIYNVVGATIQNTIVKRSNMTELGYGLAVSNASRDIYASGNHYYNCRHGITCGGDHNYGIQYNQTYIGNTMSHNDKNIGMFGMHPTYDGLVVSGNVTSGCGLGFFNAKNSVVTDNHVQANGSPGISLPDCAENTLVSNNCIETINDRGIEIATQKQGVHVVGNVIKCVGSTNYGIALLNQFSRVKISNNDIESIHRGINITTYNGITDSTDVTISDNRITSSAEAGIYIDVSECNISNLKLNNNVINAATNGIENVCGNFSSSKLSIENNTITSPTTGKCIYIYNTGTGSFTLVNVSNNICYGALDSIVFNKCTNINLVGNKIYNATRIGIYSMSNNTYYLIVHNHLLNCATPISNSSATTGRIISNNIGYNPVGNFTAPTLPASAVAYTNNYGYPCRITVSGGTVTEITLDGVATGLTSGSFVIPIGGTIAITYSSAPTWKWWGL